MSSPRRTVTFAIVAGCLAACGPPAAPGAAAARTTVKAPPRARVCADPTTAQGIKSMVLGDDENVRKVSLTLETPVLDGYDAETQKTTCSANFHLLYTGPHSDEVTTLFDMTGRQLGFGDRVAYEIQPSADGTQVVYSIASRTAENLAQWAVVIYGATAKRDDAKAFTSTSWDAHNKAGENSPAETKAAEPPTAADAGSGQGAEAQSGKVIPAAFRGEWQEDLSACGKGESDKVVVITDHTIELYEAYGEVKQVQVENRYAIKVVAAVSGEGSTSRTTYTLVLSASLDDLTLDNDTVVHRCPAKRAGRPGSGR